MLFDVSPIGASGTSAGSCIGEELVIETHLWRVLLIIERGCALSDVEVPGWR